MLGFFKRSTLEFKSIKTLTILFKSLVLPHLTYASVIWKPFTDSAYKPLRGVIHKFLRYASFKTNNSMSYFDHDYSKLFELTGIAIIKSIHRTGNHLFVGKILLDESAHTQLRDLFAMREVQYDLRSLRPLREDGVKLDLLFQSALYRLRREWNGLSGDIREIDDNNILSI